MVRVLYSVCIILKIQIPNFVELCIFLRLSNTIPQRKPDSVSNNIHKVTILAIYHQTWQPRTRTYLKFKNNSSSFNYVSCWSNEARRRPFLSRRWGGNWRPLNLHERDISWWCFDCSEVFGSVKAFPERMTGVNPQSGSGSPLLRNFRGLFKVVPVMNILLKLMSCWFMWKQWN